MNEGEQTPPPAGDRPLRRTTGSGEDRGAPPTATSPTPPEAHGAAMPPPPPAPIIEPPTPDVSPTHEPSPIPGAHRGGFQRLPTGPVDVTIQSAPAEPGTEDTPMSAQWHLDEPSPLSRGLAGWGLAFAIAGLAISLFVGWGFPIGIVAVITAIVALRRPVESRAVAVWAIALGTVSILYSAGWLLFAAGQADLLG
jgi:hypothetical protein